MFLNMLYRQAEAERKEKEGHHFYETQQYPAALKSISKAIGQFNFYHVNSW